MRAWLVVIVVVLLAIVAVIGHQFSQHKKEVRMNPTDFSLTSPAFEAGQKIPDKYTCRGQNINPPLAFSNIPEGTKSLALIMHDPDAVSGDFLHWTVWNISPDTKEIPEDGVPTGVLQGKTGFGQAHYGGPCPPTGTGEHRYIFELYALDSRLDLPVGSDLPALQNAMQGHILAQTTLTGIVAAR